MHSDFQVILSEADRLHSLLRETTTLHGRLENVQQDSEDYWKVQDNLKALLRTFIGKYDHAESIMFIDLNPNDFLKLCSLVSSHRPMEPHSFLTRISMCVEERELFQ